MADEADDQGSAQDPVTLEPSPTRSLGRRRALWGALAVIAVTAGALVVSSTGDDDPDLLPVALGADGAGAARSESSAMAADMSLAAPVTYVAGDDLPVLGGEQPAYRLAGTVAEDEVLELAEALALTGTPERSEGVWRVVTDTGTVEVYDGGGSWWYSSQSMMSVDRGSASSSGATSEGSSGGGSPGFAGCDAADLAPEEAERCAAASSTDTTLAVPPVADCPPDTACTEPDTLPQPDPITPAADLPSESEARDIALDLLARAGMDVVSAVVTVDGPYDAWYVSVEPRIDGMLVSGLMANASVGPHGEVLYASGFLAEPERLGTYPTLATSAAIDRLNEQMGGFGYLADDMIEPLPAEELTTTTILVDQGATPETVPIEEACEKYTLPDGSVGESCTSTGVAVPCITTTVPVESADATSAEAPETIVDPACSEPMPYEPPEPIEIVLHEAERTLTAMPSTDGSSDLYLVPGYRFRGEQDSVVDAVAVDDDSLAPPPQPVEPDATDGREPATGGSDPVSDPDAPVSSPARETEPVEAP